MLEPPLLFSLLWPLNVLVLLVACNRPGLINQLIKLIRILSRMRMNRYMEILIVLAFRNMPGFWWPLGHLLGTRCNPRVYGLYDIDFGCQLSDLFYLLLVLGKIQIAERARCDLWIYGVKSTQIVPHLQFPKLPPRV